jgi:hypothetical protein
MKTTMKIKLVSALSLVLISMPVLSAEFSVSGKITRTLSSGNQFGGCMVQLSVPINNGCPASGWVSLDCNGGFFPGGNGDRSYTSALAAFSLHKTVTVRVDNTKKYDTFCVASRIDVIY